MRKLAKTKRAVTLGATALALAGASVLGATSPASADPNPNNHGSAPQPITLITPHQVGVYTCADAGCPKYGGGLTLTPGEVVYADCWVSGGNVGRDGDVWYRTFAVGLDGGAVVNVGWSWTFGPYVDYANAFRNVPGLPHC
jgi:hypothetical protein